jgi:hypothetical protein
MQSPMRVNLKIFYHRMTLINANNNIKKITFREHSRNSMTII